MAEGAPRAALELDGGAVGQEVDELDALGRRRSRLERAQQGPRRRAGAAHEDAVAGPDGLHRLLGGHRAVAPLHGCGVGAGSGSAARRLAATLLDPVVSHGPGEDAGPGTREKAPGGGGVSCAGSASEDRSPSNRLDGSPPGPTRRTAPVASRRTRRASRRWCAGELRLSTKGAPTPGLRVPWLTRCTRSLRGPIWCSVMAFVRIAAARLRERLAGSPCASSRFQASRGMQNDLPLSLGKAAAGRCFVAGVTCARCAARSRRVRSDPRVGSEHACTRRGWSRPRAWSRWARPRRSRTRAARGAAACAGDP